MKKKSWQNDDIYIDCQPVNSDNENTLVGFDLVQRGLSSETVENKSGDAINLSGFLSNPVVGVLIGGLGLYAIIKVAQLGIGAMSSNNKK